jgi:hypothetical protein
MLDKLVFGMSKIDGEGSGSGAGVVRETRSEVKGQCAGSSSEDGIDGEETDEAAERLSNMSFDSHGFDKSKLHPLNLPPGLRY